MRLIPVAGLVGAGALFAAGQAAPLPQAPAQPSFRAGVELIQVDVSVLDGDRRPVRGLTAADFVVTENGQTRPVEAFAEVHLPGPDMTSADWTREVAPDVATNQLPETGRLVMVMFDQTIGPGEPVLTAKRVARAVVDALAPGDLAAVVSTHALTPQGFTADRARLRQAIGDLNSSAQWSQDQQDQWATGLARVRDETGVNLPDPPSYLNGFCFCGLCVIDQVTRLADVVREISTRQKTLLFIGSDLLLQTPDGRVGGIDVSCAPRLRDARAKMFGALDRANLVIHSIDPSGLETGTRMASSSARASLPALPTGEFARRREALSVLPARTGGRIITNANQPEDLVPDLFAESSSYYLLGFRPASSVGATSVRKLEVRVNRPGLTARARTAYDWPVTDAPRTTAASTLPDAIGSLLPGRAFELAVSAVAVMPGLAGAAAPVPQPAARPGTTPVAVVASVTIHRPALAVPERERLEVTAAAFDRRAQPRGSATQFVELQWPAGPAGPRRVDLLSRIDLAAGDYEIRVGVVSRAGGAAGAFTYLAVPDFSGSAFAVSGLALQARSAIPAAPAGFLAALLPVVPTARREFAADATVTAHVGLRAPLGGVSADVRVVTTITDSRGRVLVTAHGVIDAARFATFGTASYEYSVPMGELEPGPHLLTIDVRTGDRTDTRTATFVRR